MSSGESSKRQIKREGNLTAWECVVLVIAAIVLIAFRYHAFDLPLETDECNYAYIGARLLDGDRLYVDVWDHQPFGVFALFAGVIAIFGDAPEVFRWTATFASLITLVLVFALTRRLAGRVAAIMAAVLFALASADPSTAGEGCNREIFMNGFVLGAWVLAWRNRHTGGWSLIAAGALLGIGSTIKTVLAIHWVALAMWLVVCRLHKRRRYVDAPPARDIGAGVAKDSATVQFSTSMSGAVVRCLALFSAGPVVVWLSVTAYFALTHRFAEYVDAVFLFNLSYSASDDALPARFIQFFAPPRHPLVFAGAWPLWVATAVAGVWSLIACVRRQSESPLAVLLLLLSGYVAICLPGRAWPHYYYLLIPTAAIATAVVIDRLAAFLGSRAPGRARAMVHAPRAVWLVVPICLFYSEYDHYLRQPTFGITVNRYNSRDFWGRSIGEKVRSVTDPDDTIFVYGNEAEIYYYARRRCASRFTMITGVASGDSRDSGIESRRSAMMADLERSRPRVVLVLFDEEPFPQWVDFLHEYYGEPIGADLHDKSREAIMWVFARKDNPVSAINWDWDRAEVGGWFPRRR